MPFILAAVALGLGFVFVIAWLRSIIAAVMSALTSFSDDIRGDRATDLIRLSLPSTQLLAVVQFFRSCFLLQLDVVPPLYQGYVSNI